MPPLQRAFALANVPDRAVLVAEDLHFDMARGGDELFGVHRAVAEERLCLAGHSVERRAQIFLAFDKPQAFAAA